MLVCNINCIKLFFFFFINCCTLSAPVSFWQTFSYALKIKVNVWCKKDVIFLGQQVGLAVVQFTTIIWFKSCDSQVHGFSGEPKCQSESMHSSCLCACDVCTHMGLTTLSGQQYSYDYHLLRGEWHQHHFILYFTMCTCITRVCFTLDLSMFECYTVEKDLGVNVCPVI